MLKRKRPLFVGVTLLSVLLLAVSCGAPEREETRVEPPAPEEEQPAAAVVTEEELPEVSAPTVSEALLTFYTGDVFVDEAGEWVYAEIGDAYARDDTLFVETGYAELQFGESAVVRLQENTEVTLSQISLEPGASDVELKLAAGGVINKVERLARGDSFRVRTDTAVMGVRGTEFAVQVGADRGTKVAVREGRVAVLPASVDLGSLERRARQAGNEELADAIREIEDAAPVVEANQEADVTAEEAEREAPREAIQEVEAAVAEAERGGAQVAQEQIAEITQRARQEVEENARTAIRPARELSAESEQQLRQTTEMRVLPVTLSVAEQEDQQQPQQPQVRLVRIALEANPRGAQILLDGFPVGRGRFSGLFQEGEELAFTVRQDGYEPTRLDVVANRGRSFSVSLIEQPPREQEEEPEEQVEPEPEPEPEPEIESAPEPEPEATPEVSRAQEPAAPAEVERAPEPEPEPQPVSVELEADPADARIRILGGASGTGELETEALPGTELRIEASRPGFATLRRTITVGAGGRTYQLNLEPRPIEAVVPVSREPLIRGLAESQGVVIAADAAGILSAASPRGSRLWTVGTPNTGNENSEPVAAGGTVYFSGAAELVAVDAASGSVTGRRSLTNAESHLFGRQVAVANGSVYLPTDEEILRLDPNSLGEQGRIPLPSGSKMSPALVGNNLILADQQGTLLVLNAETGATVHSIPTGAAQPVALAPAIAGNTAIVVGRRGLAAAVDIRSGNLVWERQLTGDAERGVFTNPVADGRRVYIHARETLYVLNLTDGSDAFTAITDAVAPPLVKEGRIYYGSLAGELVVRDAGSGRAISRLDIPSVAGTRPVDLGERLAIGTKEGEIIFIHPAGIR